LEASARRSGALTRRRGVRSAASLLRLALGYGACGLSLRAAAAWAELAGVASLSDVALLNRLRGAADWLGEIVGALLSERLSETAAAAAGYRLRLVDATTLSQPGSRLPDWRVHLCCRLGARPQIEQVELSDGRGSESLRRFARQSGDIEIGDRGYAKAADLAAVLQAGGDFIVRTGWGSLGLRQPDGAPFDLFARLDRIPEHGIAEAALALALDRAGSELLPVRLIMLRLPEAAAERNRRRARRKSRKQGKTIKEKTLRAAGFVLLVTSLPPERFTPADILALYRLRWQIELVFKRLKSLLHLDALPAKDKELARAWIYAKLIAALALQDITGQVLDSPPSAARNGGATRVALAPAALAARDHPLRRHPGAAQPPRLGHSRATPLAASA
jgi:hypothetical protein